MAKATKKQSVAVTGNLALSADPTLSKKLDSLLTLVQTLFQKVNQMASDLTASIDTLTAKVAALQTVEDGAIALLNGLSAQIAALKTQTNDPAAVAAIDALTAAVDAKTAALAAAVTANTPA